MTELARRELPADASLVVLPEGLFPQILQKGGRVRTFEPVGDAAVLVGGRSLDANSNQYNSAVLLSSEIVDQVYSKRKLFPLGEYLPGEQLVPALRHLFPAAGRLRAGENVQMPLSLNDTTQLSLLICLEDLLPSLVRQGSTPGVLASLSNDTAFSHTIAGELHSKFARLRAIENRRELIRSSRGGESGVLDARGRWKVRARGRTDQVLHALVLPHDVQTLYARFGDWLGWFALSGWILMYFRQLRKRSDTKV